MNSAEITTPDIQHFNWTLRAITPCLGVEVQGVDLKNVDKVQAQAIEVLFNQHCALLFRNQRLEACDLVRFSGYFGDLDGAPVNEAGKTAVEGYPEIYVISNIKGKDGKAVGSLGAGEAAWHTDMSYLDNPPRASLLYSVEIPSEGGNTWLADMFGALDSLPRGLRKKIAGRRIKHDGTYNSAGFVRQGLEASDDPMTCAGTFHPAICQHPETGREVLFLGRRRNAYIEGLSLVQSEQLLDELWQHATDPKLTYSHSWQEGDVLMWDNRSTLHRRDPFDKQARRYMLRTQIKGKESPRAGDGISCNHC